MKLRERSMYPHLGSYLERRGYEVSVGVRPRPGSPREFDVVGVRTREREAVTIEAKNGHFSSAFRQAALRMFVSDYVYVSFPRTYARFAARVHGDCLAQAGIGLLAVDGCRVRMLSPARRSEFVSAERRDALISMVTGGTHGGR